MKVEDRDEFTYSDEIPSISSFICLINKYGVLGMVNEAHNQKEEEPDQAVLPRTERPTPHNKNSIKTSAEKKQCQDVSADELFHRQSVALVLMGDFNLPDISWEYKTAVTSRSWKFLKFVGDNVLPQVLRPCPAWSPELEDYKCRNCDFPFVDTEIIRDRLYQLNVHKSMGLDGVHLRVLKELADVMAGPLSIIYQRYWESGEIPADWKLANAVPIYKKGRGKTKGATDLVV
ncbi:rna-directed dna polymerase from mobile element hypothetical protein [Limosa lapponica baueri]|uniref:Rna-directed dna polymerase from mobile element jockey-like n=1 Tax=Limosa lapponica baueri TaxID=1758121 RepID=A0A2I0UEF4_LIMLA|nr:rna-directed dna polymerase from mobile element hypothetical protein [Limosa lapponica baueri]